MKHVCEYKKIKDVCTKGSSNLQQKKIVEFLGNYPVFGASGFVQNINTYQQEKPYIGIVKDGSGVGRVNTYPAKSSLLGTMQYIIPNNNMNIGYVAYCLQSLQLSKYASGAAIPHIYFRDYGETYIPVPPLPVQEQICSLLDKLNLLIEKKKEQVAELDNLAQSLFYDMFGDPVVNEKGWATRPFEECIQTVKYTTKIKSNNFLKQGLYPIISQEEEYISGFWNDETDVFKVNSPVVIFGDHTRVLKYVDFDFVLGADGVKILLPIPEIDAWYLFHFLKAYKIPSLGYSRHYKLLKEIDFLLPPLSLQKAFAKKVEAIERQKELINQSIKDVQTLFDAKMDYYFGD